MKILKLNLITCYRQFSNKNLKKHNFLALFSWLHTFENKTTIIKTEVFY